MAPVVIIATMPNQRFLVIATSLDPDSRSQILARRALAALHQRKIEATMLDLRELPPIPQCGLDLGSAATVVDQLKNGITEASHLLLAVPIYNYDVNSAAKNIVEHVGKALLGKTVGFLCAAGGKGSYMSVMGLANSLMLDFRCWINPRFVYATGSDFTGDEITSSEVLQRIEQIIDEMK